MGGLARLCKMYGGMKFKDRHGKEVVYVWDYVRDEPRRKDEMTQDELLASDRAKREAIKERNQID
jgi:hypothetical protein